MSHFFHLKKNIFTAVKYCSILHGHVCVMLFSKFQQLQDINDQEPIQSDEASPQNQNIQIGHI